MFDVTSSSGCASSQPASRQEAIVDQFRRLMRQFSRADAAAPGFTSRPPGGGDYQRQVRAAETRLLYENACTGLVATIVIASLLAYEQWFIVSPFVVSLWLLVHAADICGEIHARAPILACVAERPRHGRWNVAFVAGAAMAAAGWGGRPPLCFIRQPDH